MAHEKKRELLEKFSHFVNDHYAFGFLQLMFDDIDLFLSTLPEEKEEKQYPDTEADGYVFCGKCGKMIEV